MSGSGGALRELIAMLAFDVDTKGLKKADDELKSTLETAKRVGETIGLALGLHEAGEFIGSLIEMGAAVEHASQQMGIATDDLQAFQYAAATVGVSTDEANTSLQHFSRVIGEARLGNAEANKTLAQLGFTMDDIKSNDLPAQLAKLSEGFSRLTGSSERNALAFKTIGKSGGPMVNLLQKGGAGVENLYREFEQLGGGLGEDFIASAGEAEHGMVMLRTAGKGLSSEIGAVLLPYVAEFAGGLGRMVAKFREVAQHTNIVRNTLITLAVIAGVLVVIWGIMNIEILIVVAALALLALAVDDVITFVEGGDSVLGRFIDKIYGVGASKKVAEELKDAWHEVSDAFGKLWDAVKSLGPDLKNLFDTFTNNKADVNNTKTGIQSVADAVAGLTGEITKAVTWFDKLTKKMDDFAKAHPLLVHAAQREVNQVSKGIGLTEGIGVGGALRAVGGDLKELFTGDTSDLNNPSASSKGGGFAQIPSTTVPGSIMLTPAVQQQQTNHVSFYGVAGASDAVNKLNATMSGAQTDANNAAFAAIGGGAAP